VNSEHVVSGKPQGSKLVVSEGYPSGESEEYPSGEVNFVKLRNSPGYIDKTQFIAPIRRFKAALLCRPRRFGKTHTVNMLQRFHGVQYRLKYDDLFKVCALGINTFAVCSALIPDRV